MTARHGSRRPARDRLAVAIGLAFVAGVLWSVPLARAGVVSPETTSTVLGSDQNPSVRGQAVTFTATVSAPSGPAAGSVQFRDGTTNLGSPQVLNGSGAATYSTSALAVGSHSISAEFSGDGVLFQSSASNTLTQQVTLIPTRTTLASDQNPSVHGQAVTFTATVAAVSPGTGTPTGTVHFNQGATDLGSATVAGDGTASTSALTSLATGSLTIKATYAATGDFESSSGTLTQSVQKAATTTAVESSVPNPSTHGEQVRLIAKVAVNAPGSGTPGGRVQFKEGSANLGASVALVSGAAQLDTTAISTGNTSITASYLGNADYATSGSAGLSQEVTKSATSIALSSDAGGSSVYGQLVTLTATVTAVSPGAGTPTGTVQFKDGGSNVGSPVSLDGAGKAVLATRALDLGPHSLTATYGGDADFKASPESSAVSHSVGMADTSTTVSSNHPTSVHAQSVTFTATVSAASPGSGVPTGSVGFADESGTLGTVPLDGAGKAALTISTLSTATHTISATYSGDTNFAAGPAGTMSQVVNRAPTTTTVTSSPDPSTVGATVTIDVSVSPAPPDGSPVTLRGFDPPFTRVLSLTGGTATWTVSDLQPGQTIFRAKFAATTDYAGSLGLTGHTVKARTDTSLAADFSSVEVGQSVTLTATVATAASGNVRFLDGSTRVGQVVVGSNGRAVLTLSGLSLGSHSLTARYLGTASAAGSLSPPITVTVISDTGVRFSSAGIAYPIFYPYSDTYRDTLPVRGRLLERVNVNIQVRNAASALVLSTSLGWKNPGSYTYKWTGRRPNGSILPAGTYTVVQTLRDAGGHVQTVTSPVSLSLQRMTYSTATWTRNAGGYRRPPIEAGSGFVDVSFVYASGMQISGGALADDLAMAGYQVPLPAADDYKSFKVAVSGQPFTDPGDPDPAPPGPLRLGFWNWSTDAIGATGPSGTTAGSWAFTSTESAAVSSSRVVRAMVAAYGPDGANWDLRTVTITVTYGRLH